MQDQCVPLPINDQPGIYRCAICGWENKTPRERPPRRNCRTHDVPPEAELPERNRTLAQLTAPCEDCDHYLITEVCDLWPWPIRCNARRRWVHAIAFGRFGCPLGFWLTVAK